jgi:outer membrane protein assembly factor BamB
MKNSHKKSFRSSALQPLEISYLNSTGNVLIYVVVLMLIFGVLGVVMVSLFTTSTASTVTRNDTRRAIYMSESGMRYAFSELRKADFDEDFIINTLNTTTYTVNNAGSFTINVFSPWFDADGTQAVASEQNLDLEVPIGEIPPGYAFPQNSIYAINFEFTGISPTAGGITGASAEIEDIVAQSGTTLRLKLNDDFNASNGERVALALKPTGSQQVSQNGDLIVDENAKSIFPRFGGAFNIRRNDYYYEELIDEGGSVRLRNISVPAESQNNLSVDSSDYVIMSPRNYLVVPTGTSDAVTYGGNYLFGKGIYDSSLIRPGSRKPDITAEDLASHLSEQESGTDFFQTDLIEGTLNIGGGLTKQFGSAFFNANMSIGGNPNYCQQGACLFALGVRAFFLLKFNNQNQGDGITFTLINASGKDALNRPLNTETSAGGDFELSELMGYAGDSRTATGGFLDSTEPRGLQPPKIAVEFDTRTNNRVGDDPPPDYCADASTVNTDSRNDPLTSNKDAVQYVFWGRTGFLNIPCRNNNPLYDDNRHDADGEEPTEEWRFGMGGPASVWRPAIGPDGTIYASDQVSTLYAFNQDGTIKWTFNLTDANDYMPGIDRTSGPNDGTIYSDTYGSSLVAINPDGSEKWRSLLTSPYTDINSTPIVDPYDPYKGTIYFGTDEAHALIALNPDDGSEIWRLQTGGGVDNVAALSPDGTSVYFVSNDNNLYAVNKASRIAGLPFPQPGEWTFPILTEPDEVNSSPTVNPADGTIYVASDDHKLYALNPAARAAGLAFPQTGEWAFTTGGEVEPSAAIDDGGTPGDKSDDTIYIGSDDHYFYAIRANGTQKWRYQTNSEIVSSAVVDLDGTVYVGSDDDRMYAFNPDGTLKWFFETGAPVQSSPVLGQAGFIHIGSNDTNIYTISQFADPRNFKDQDKKSGKLLTVEDLDSSVSVGNNTDWLNGAGAKGSWAVRLEVECLLRDENGECDSNANGEFEYELRLWIRQCPDQNDFPCSNILGTFFQDTRIAYDYTAVKDLPMVQRIRLSSALSSAKNGDPPNDGDFYRFFFGFTGAAGDVALGGESLDATISQFQLSFIRPGDPVIDCDKNNWPLEDSPDPLPDCALGF